MKDRTAAPATHQVLENEQVAARLVDVHAQVVGHDVVLGRLQLVVAHVVLRLRDGRHIGRVLVVVGRLRVVQVGPLRRKHTQSLRVLVMNVF